MKTRYTVMKCFQQQGVDNDESFASTLLTLDVKEPKKSVTLRKVPQDY